jgi:hypothetical protein
MQRTAALLPNDIGLQHYTLYTNRRMLGVSGAEPVAIVGEHAMGRAVERGFDGGRGRGVLRAIVMSVCALRSSPAPATRVGKSPP